MIQYDECMSDFRRRLAKAFADYEVNTGRRVRRAEVNDQTLQNIKHNIADKWYPRWHPKQGESVGNVWGVDIYLNEELTGNNIIIES
jgi:hypothetical protein